MWDFAQTLPKRLLLFLLKRTIGPFLVNELDVDNLDLDFSLGTSQVRRAIPSFGSPPKQVS